jgi:two-component system chemotaxis response regulator CheY
MNLRGPFDMPLQASTFLVVDDFGTMRRIVGTLIRELGAKTIVEAEDGRDACAKLERGGIDFIVSDWDMPSMTGVELLRHVRSDPALADVPFLLVTAQGLKSNVVEAARAGADGYILKPFNAAVLGEKIDQILGRRSAAPAGLPEAG